MIEPVIQKQPYIPDCGDILSGREYLVREVKEFEFVGNFIFTQAIDNNIRGNVSCIRGDITELRGDVSNICGDITYLYGDVSNIYCNVTCLCGNVTGLCGNASNVSGDVDEAQISQEERDKGNINIKDLVIGT